MLGNFSKDEKTDPYAVDVMPYTGLNQSNYHGDYVMAGLTVKAGAGASMVGSHSLLHDRPRNGATWTRRR